jgi:hypothetical protein
VMQGETYSWPRGSSGTSYCSREGVGVFLGDSSGGVCAFASACLGCHDDDDDDDEDEQYKPILWPNGLWATS